MGAAAQRACIQQFDPRVPPFRLVRAAVFTPPRRPFRHGGGCGGMKPAPSARRTRLTSPYAPASNPFS
jgi:hypothetical protein